MSNTYNWTIHQIEYHPSAQGQTKVAYNLHWRYSVTDETENFTTDIYGSTPVAYDPNTSYVEFDNLTQEIVVGWLETALDSGTIESFRTQLDAQLSDIITPKSVIVSPPWTTQ